MPKESKTKPISVFLKKPLLFLSCFQGCPLYPIQTISAVSIRKKQGFFIMDSSFLKMVG